MLRLKCQKPHLEKLLIMGRYKLIILKTHMLGSQFHRCLYQSNSTAMYSQQTVEGFDKKKEPELILE